MSKSIILPIPKLFFQQKNFPELTSNLNSLAQVTKVESSSHESTLTLEITNTDAYNPIIDAISKWGYDIPTSTVKLGITGMTCASCVIHVESSISNLNGVINSNVNLATNQATITVINDVVSHADITSAVNDIGYGTINASELNRYESNSHSNSILFKSAISILATITIYILDFSNIQSIFSIPDLYVFLIIATPIQLWAGSYFYISAWKALKHYRSNMQTLIAIGTTTSYLYSLIITIIDSSTQNRVFFEASTAIIGIVLIGRYIEEQSKYKVSNA
ncbi:uncharacterized protein METZ01_LOCUS321961, partial [marine metagenome]